MSGPVSPWVPSTKGCKAVKWYGKPEQLDYEHKKDSGGGGAKKHVRFRNIGEMTAATTFAVKAYFTFKEPTDSFPLSLTLKYLV